MWINNTFIHQKWMKPRQKQQIPRGNSVSPIDDNFRRRSSVSIDTKVANAHITEQRNKESELTNASNIGTALMVINSYRNLAKMWAITGLFPLLLCMVSSANNSSALEMTINLQSINLLTTDSSQDSCDFLTNSMSAWTAGVVTQTYGDAEHPTLLTLEIVPDRCRSNTSRQETILLCEPFLKMDDLYTEDTKLKNICKLYSDKEESNMWNDLESIANVNGIRVGSITSYSRTTLQDFTYPDTNITLPTTYSVNTSFDHSFSIRTA